MATSISNFKAALSSGGARPSLFSLSITDQPSGFAVQSTALSGLVPFHCTVAEIPGLEVTPIEKQYFGRTTKIPGDITFAGTFSTTFINTEDFAVRTSLEAWTKGLNGVTTNFYATGLHAVWAGAVRLTQFNKTGGSVIHYNFQDCWPSNLSAIDLSHDSVSTIEDFTVTWEYNYYTTEIGTGTKPQTDAVHP